MGNYYGFFYSSEAINIFIAWAKLLQTTFKMWGMIFLKLPPNPHLNTGTIFVYRKEMGEKEVGLELILKWH